MKLFVKYGKNMSRIGRKPILIPESTTIESTSNMLKIKGKLGELEVHYSKNFTIDISDRSIVIHKLTDGKAVSSEYGRLGSVIANCLTGVSQGWHRRLEMVGTGYRARLEGQKLVLSLGYSHPIEIVPPQGINFSVEGQNVIIVSGIDKLQVGQIASNIRSARPPEPYKGKGVKYQGEVIRRKAGKAAK